MPSGTWRCGIAVEAIDTRVTQLNAEATILLILIEGCARTRTWAYPGLATLAARLGRGERTVQMLLKTLETQGWIERVHSSQNRLQGIILRRRLDPGQPAADTSEKLEAARDAVRGRNSLRPEKGGRIQPVAAPARQILRPQPEADCAPSLKPIAPELESVEEHEAKSIVGPNGVSDSTRSNPAPFERAAETQARDIHAALYQGREQSLANRDWGQWRRMYLCVARQLLRGELSSEQVEQAITVARKPSTQHRGRRFLGEIREALRASKQPQAGDRIAPREGRGDRQPPPGPRSGADVGSGPPQANSREVTAQSVQDVRREAEAACRRLLDEYDQAWSRLDRQEQAARIEAERPRHRSLFRWPSMMDASCLMDAKTRLAAELGLPGAGSLNRGAAV